jgi:methyl-accepting chemotaxis protein
MNLLHIFTNLGIFRRLNIGQRSFASLCLFALPMGVLFYFNLDQLGNNIRFAEKELQGNRYQQPLIHLIQSVAEHQQGEPRAAQEIDALLGKLSRLETEIGSSLGFAKAQLESEGLERLQVSQLQAKWQQLKSMTSQPSPADGIASLADELVADCRSMISRAGDISNLTLDPEMDTYYMADISSVASAQAIGRLRQASLLLLPQLPRQDFSRQDFSRQDFSRQDFSRQGSSRTIQLSSPARTQAAIYAATIRESDFDRILGDLDTAVRENAKAPRGASTTLKSGLAGPRATYEKSTLALLTQLSQLAEGKGVPAASLQQAFALSGQSAAALSAKTVEELDGALRARIAGFAAYRVQLISGTLLALAISSLLFFVVIRSITGPLAVAVERFEQVSAGNLALEIPQQDLDRSDEIGQLSRSTQSMLARLRKMLHDLKQGVSTLSLASNNVQAAAGQMTQGSRETSSQVHTVAAAAEQMSANVGLVASSMQITSHSLDQVAGATEQMTTTISEIARNSEQARRVTSQATQQADQVTEKINELGKAAREIGKVTEAITAISAQTNLLALNATIEAARAGAAGKGFAVVANEIKALAQQTAVATEDIRLRISSVQNSTEEGIQDVERVSAVIAEVSHIVASIATAIEEQSVSTKDIARNIGQASQGVHEASTRMSESSVATGEIAREIVVVNQTASGMASSGERLRSSAVELGLVSNQLESAAAQFHI